MSFYDAIADVAAIRSYLTKKEYLRERPEPYRSAFDQRWVKPRVRVQMERKVEA